MPKVPAAPRLANHGKPWGVLEQVALVNVCRNTASMDEASQITQRTIYSMLSVLDEVLKHKSRELRFYVREQRKTGKPLPDINIEGLHFAHREGFDSAQRWASFRRIIVALDRLQKELSDDRKVARTF